MSRYLVTQGDYLSIVGTNPSYCNGVHTDVWNGTCNCDTVDYGVDLTRPVEMVTWYDATSYCALRTEKERAGGLIPTNYVLSIT